MLVDVAHTPRSIHCTTPNKTEVSEGDGKMAAPSHQESQECERIRSTLGQPTHWTPEDQDQHSPSSSLTEDLVSNGRKTIKKRRRMASASASAHGATCSPEQDQNQQLTSHFMTMHSPSLTDISRPTDPPPAYSLQPNGSSGSGGSNGSNGSNGLQGTPSLKRSPSQRQQQEQLEAYLQQRRQQQTANGNPSQTAHPPRQHHVTFRTQRDNSSHATTMVETTTTSGHDSDEIDNHSHNHHHQNPPQCNSSEGDCQENHINAAVMRPDQVIFNKYTRCFKNEELECLYQQYTMENWFNRARWHILLWMGLHVVMTALYLGLGHSPFDLMSGHVDDPDFWAQWVYLIPALPFAVLPMKWNPFRMWWKATAGAVVVLYMLGYQLLLACACQHALDAMQTKIYDTYICDGDRQSNNSNNGKVAIFHMSRSHFATLLETILAYSGVCTFIFAISMRIEFLQVLLLTCAAIVMYFSVLVSYGYPIEVVPTFGYGFALFWVCYVSYSSDARNRRWFLAKYQIERENENLQNSLHQAEAALMNDASDSEQEKRVVSQVLNVASAKHLEIVRIAFSELHFLSAIGRGAMGDVIKAKYFGTIVVCKRMRREHINENSLRCFREEIELMSCLRHPNIVQFIGASWDSCTNLCIVMEYLENGDLHHVLHSSIGKNFSWSDPFLKMAVDVVQGMVYLHSLDPPLVHRDLKSVNVLCSATFGCKVGDFGLSRRYNKDIDALTTLVGTPFWLAPEIIRNEKYGPKADVYSFGIVLTELETRQTPYHDFEETGLKVLMRVAKDHLRPSLPSSCLPNRRQLIMDCLRDDPSSRPTFAQVLMRLQAEVSQEIEMSQEKSTFERRALLKKLHNNQSVGA